MTRLRVPVSSAHSGCCCGRLVLGAVICIALVRSGVELATVVSRGQAGCHTSDDNIAGVSFDKHLCPDPIDIVYTWVNGSDPVFLRDMEAWRERLGLAPADEDIGTGSSDGNAHSGADGSDGSGSDGSDGSDGGSGDSSGDSSDDGSGGGDDPASSNRFRDNNELRYSMRSIEKYAPWVRKIHVLTNGQVPNWLNIEHPRIHLVTHADIFPNSSHLPVFSSPAIEAHLHRIPGLSNRFIYFNDDVFLGNPVWPDDFATRANGQKVYLSWEVPKCNPGCIESWIGDGFCDQACNVSACDWDFPDCVNATSLASGQGSTASTCGDLLLLPVCWISTLWWWWCVSASCVSASWDPPAYCTSGCPNNWIGDKTCDKRCNVLECAYDGTDCGLEALQNDLPGNALAASVRGAVPCSKARLAGHDVAVRVPVPGPRCVRRYQCSSRVDRRSGVETRGRLESRV